MSIRDPLLKTIRNLQMILVTYSNILIGPLMIYAAAVAIRKYQFCVGKKS